MARFFLVNHSYNRREDNGDDDDDDDDDDGSASINCCSIAGVRAFLRAG